MKRVLVIAYSQSGQLDEILDHFLEPFEGQVQLERIYLKPATPFEFPWATDRFFDVMPESVLEEPIELQPFETTSSSYDLIIFGYQPWFLSPSLPATAVLQLPQFKALLKDTPVVTVIGARNMWMNSQESIVNYIKQASGHLVANIPLIDRHQNLISAYTILHWMLTGKKTRKWGIFPTPGVEQEEIDAANSFGKPVLDALLAEDYQKLQQQILAQNKIDIHSSILFIEQRAKRLFLIWANLVKRKGTTSEKRRFWLNVYKYYLVVALFFISPILLTIDILLFRPFRRKQIRKDKQHFLYLGIDPPVYQQEVH